MKVRLIAELGLAEVDARLVSGVFLGDLTMKVEAVMGGSSPTCGTGRNVTSALVSLKGTPRRALAFEWRIPILFNLMAPHLVLLEELDDAASSTFLRDQMYVLFQREIWEEEDWRTVLRDRCLEVSERIRWLGGVSVKEDGEVTWKRGGVMIVMVLK
ncbi:hypothetical protein Tco_1352493 [Tanacetum coccineum]